MPRPPQTEAQRAASAAKLAAINERRRAKKAEAEASAQEVSQPVETTVIDVPSLDVAMPQIDGGPARAAIATPREASPVEETITVPLGQLDAFLDERVEQRLQAALAARLAGAPQGVLPATPTEPPKPVWSFLHADSPGFAVLLPRDLQHRTPDGYVRFRQEGATKNRLRPKRGKYVTHDADIAAFLNGMIAAGKLPQVVVENDKNLLKLMQQEAAQAAA